MSSIDIQAERKIQGGVLYVEATADHVTIDFHKGEESCPIADEYGETFSWEYYYKKWRGLSGSALQSAENKMVLDYAEKEFLEILGNLEPGNGGSLVSQIEKYIEKRNTED